LYKNAANKCVTRPQNILVKKGKEKSKTIGLYNNETNKPNQKEEHSGHNKSFLT
jgi:hypothetical protein